jgi:nucleoside-diphosphate-sugar epimerase
VNPAATRVLITGAAGYVGARVGALLAPQMSVLGTDLRPRTDLGFEVLAGRARSADWPRSSATTHHARGAPRVGAGGAGTARGQYDIDVNGTRTW